MATLLYKIIAGREWARAEQEARVPWAAVDVADGFVHLSDASQVRETARLHFAGRRDLVIVAVDASRIPAGALRWEASRGGRLFPHVYGDIPLTAVTAAHPLPIEDGAFVFPDAIPDSSRRD